MNVKWSMFDVSSAVVLKGLVNSGVERPQRGLFFAFRHVKVGALCSAQVIQATVCMLGTPGHTWHFKGVMVLS